MDEIKFSVRIKYATLIIGVLVTIVALLLNIYLVPIDDNLAIDDKINTIVQIFGFGIALTTLIYVAINQHFILKSKLEENLLQRKKNSSEFMRIWSTNEMFEFATIARKVWYNKGKKSDAEYVKEIYDNESNYIAIVSILNFFEQISQLIDEKIVDEKMLKNYYYHVVIGLKDRYAPLIQQRRKDEKTNFIWCDFEKLANRWDSESTK